MPWPPFSSLCPSLHLSRADRVLRSRCGQGSQPVDFAKYTERYAQFALRVIRICFNFRYCMTDAVEKDSTLPNVRRAGA
jgi:hypothetical protein